MTRTHRRPGRPTLFDTAAQQRYLTARAIPGTTQAQAAAAAGVASRTVRDTRHTNPAFRKADDTARTTARALAADAAPHGESRYKNHGCRCTTCTAAASKARARLREHDRKQTAPHAPVTRLNTTGKEKPKSFPLAVAS